MKTDDLITKLKKLDPKGEMEVSIDGIDISHIEDLPYGYDGWQEVLVRDGNEVVAAQILRDGGYRVGGKRLVIKTQSVEDALFENHALPVEVKPTDPRKEAEVEEWRRQGREG